MRFHPPCSNGKAPHKGNRAPMNQIRYSEEGDWESGFHYYGARYYWSETLTGWLSVDPMMDKYPNISPYNYCMWNPIVIVDPDGMDSVYITKQGKVAHRKSGGHSTFVNEMYHEATGIQIK